MIHELRNEHGRIDGAKLPPIWMIPSHPLMMAWSEIEDEKGDEA